VPLNKATVAFTRLPLTQAISAGKAERKDYQIDNDVWHVVGRTTKDDKNGLLNRTRTIKFLPTISP
jgi:hypothetical protein